MIIHHGRKKSRAPPAQFFFSLVSILVFNLSWLPSVLAATGCTAVTEIPQAECQTLIALYNSTAGPNWTDKDTNNWNVTDTPCSWIGITCVGGSITEIVREKENLSGSIPDLSALTQLSWLNLGDNQLSGSIPDLSALTNLQHLYLVSNQLSGSIPDLSALTNLQFLALNGNQLSGNISNLSALTQLQSLFLADNQFSGTIPDLSALTQLQSLGLSVNQLTGTIPDLSALTQLQILHLSFNQLSGTIPNLSVLTQLQELDLSYNGLTGTIPDLSALTQLQKLWLNGNQLTGSIPDLSALTQLQTLDLSMNQLTGPIPDLSALTQLQSLGLSSNGLTGPIPDLSALTQLQSLLLDVNQLYGEIPSSLVNLNLLTELSLGNNHLTASDPTLIDFLNSKDPAWTNQTPLATNCTVVTEISQTECETLIALYNSTNGPNWTDKDTNNWNVTDTPCSWTGITCVGESITEISRINNNLNGSIPDLSALTNLKYLYLDNNQLSGNIPPNLSALTNLQHLYLSNNQLSGDIPDLSALTNLKYLYLDSNQLSGNISNLSALTQLQFLALNGNQLSGNISNLSALTQLQYLYLAGNQLSGTIPDLSALTQLQSLGLSVNQLTGIIPNLSALTRLQSLDLPFNLLSGPIPDLSALTQLQSLDLSYNGLTGPIPDLSVLTQLGRLWLSDNQLCGQIPSSLVNLNLLTELHLENNHLTASDPTLIAFLNSKDPAWINQTPCGGTSPPSTPLPSPTPPDQPLPPPMNLTMNLTINFGGNGHGSVTTDPSGVDCDSSQLKCSYSYDTNTWINMITKPAADSKFTGWSGNQSDCDNGELFMNGSHSCTAYFELLRFPLTITTVGQGQVSSDPVGIHCGDQCQSPFDINTNVTLTAIPEKGWQFQEWSGDCNNQGQVVMKENQACQATFTPLPPDFPPVADAILTTCANAITWDGQTHEDAVVKNIDTLNLVGSSTPLKIKALCNYGTIQETAGEPLSIQVNPTDGFIYNEGRILGKDGQSSTAKSTIPTNLINEGDNGSSIKLNAGTQLYHQGIIQAGAGGNGYFKAGQGGSVEIYANQIIQTGTISAGNGGEGNAHQPAWDGFGSYFGDSENTLLYGNQPVWGGNGGKTLLQAVNSLNATASATTSSGTGGNAYVWCQNGAHLIDWEFDGRWYKGTCVSDSNVLIAIPTPGSGGDLIKLSPSLYDLSQASSGKGLYYEPSTITMGPETRLQAQEDIFIFGGDDWILDLRHLSPGAISTPGNITLTVGKGSTIDLRGNTSQVFQAGGQFKVFTDTLLLDNEISLENLVAAQGGIVTNPSKIIHLVILNGPKQLTGEPQATLPMELELINGGPEADTYNLTVSDSASWNLTTLPAALSVAGLGHETLRLNVTLPATIGEKDTITVTATSAAEPTVTSSTEIVVEVVGNQTQPATTAIEINKQPITTASVAASNGETAADNPVELPPVTDNDSSTIPAVEFFSSLPPETPPCYASGLIDWVCNANGQKLTDLTVGPNGMIAYGTLVGTLTNQGRVSNLTLEPQSHLTGGIVTGYLINHGEMMDFEFRGAALVGGTLAGQITNTGQIGGYFRDVQLAAGTHLRGGQLAGKISGDAQAPALLEDLAIQTGSHLQYVTIGDGVKLAAGITWGEGVQFNHPNDDPRLVPKQSPQPVTCDTQLPSLGVTAINAEGQVVETQCQCAGGISVNGGSFEPTVKMRLADTVEIRGTVCVDPEQIGQLADLVVYLDYQPLNATAEEKQHYMLDSEGEVLPWDGQVAHLVAFQQTMLAAVQEVLLYQGQLATTGKLNLFFGYRLMDGTLISNEQAIEITIAD